MRPSVSAIRCFPQSEPQGISTTSVLAQVNYVAVPTEVAHFLPINIDAAIFTGASGFANKHVTLFIAGVYDGGTAMSDYFGLVTMQTKQDGGYKHVFESMTTYGPGENDHTFATTWVTCSGIPEDSIRTCLSHSSKSHKLRPQ
jgi:hypothetical protein